MKNWLLVFLTMALSPIPADAREGEPRAAREGETRAARKGGTTVGNGGDYVRSTFIRMGEAVLTFLTDSPEGRELVWRYELDLEMLSNTISIRRISVTRDPLADNTGSDVAAVITDDGNLRLRHAAWTRFFDRDEDVYWFVFHEMLRLAGVNDDEERISKALRPFPARYRIRLVDANRPDSDRRESGQRNGSDWRQDVSPTTSNPLGAVNTD